jgi:hypothetical protein
MSRIAARVGLQISKKALLLLVLSQIPTLPLFVYRCYCVDSVDLEELALGGTGLSMA